MTGPAWTRRSAGVEPDHRGMWPLGLEPVGLGMVARLLPGLTNSTVHVRYYPFFAWVFDQYERRRAQLGQPYRRADQDRWRERMEAALRAASFLHESDMNAVVGSTEALRVSQDPDAPFPIGESRAPTAFVPAAYSASWRALQVGEREQGGRVRLTRELGLPMARAFHQQLQVADGGTGALDALLSEREVIPSRALHQLSDALRLRQVAPDEVEHALLLELLFRTEAPGENEQWRLQNERRRASLTLLLWIAREGAGSIESVADIHRLWATGRFPDGRAAQPPAGLADTFRLWQRYQERQYEKVALYGFWEVALNVLRARGQEAPTGEILAECLWLIEHSAVLTDWCGEGALDRPLGDVRRSIEGRLDEQEQGSALDPLYRQMLGAESESERFGSATILLLATCSVWERRAEDLSDAARRWHARHGRARLDLEYLCSDLSRRSHLSLGDYLHYALEHHVLSQAVQVAIEKRDGQGNYRFFVASAGDRFRIVKNPRWTNMGFDMPRAWSSYRLLAGLSLVEPDANHRLTATGEATLSALLEFFTR